MAGCDVERPEHLGELGRHRRDARQRLRPVDRHSVMPDAFEQLQRAFRRESGLAVTQAHAHHAVQNQRHEANRGVRPNALRQPAILRTDFEFGFQHLEAAHIGLSGYRPGPGTTLARSSNTISFSARCMAIRCLNSDPCSPDSPIISSISCFAISISKRVISASLL